MNDRNINEKPVESELESHPAGTPTTASFVILLVTLWALNLADIFQTLYLKQSGFLAQEANYFIDFFLREGGAPFFWAKVLAMILVTSVLTRGWMDRKGIQFGNMRYTPEHGRSSIQLLLVAGVIYYTLIVVFPFIALALSGLFSSPGQKM